MSYRLVDNYLCRFVEVGPEALYDHRHSNYQKIGDKDEGRIVQAKLDGTAKGGIIIAIQEELGIPVQYIGVGEDVEDLQPFSADLFVQSLFANHM